jgi:hypothetical protein
MGTVKVWTILPFEVNTLYPMTKETIKDDGCYFVAELSDDERRFFRGIRVAPDDFRHGVDVRAVIEGISKDALVVGISGELQWGEREGWLSDRDFRELRRIVYAWAKTERCVGTEVADSNHPRSQNNLTSSLSKFWCDTKRWPTAPAELQDWARAHPPMNLSEYIEFTLEQRGEALVVQYRPRGSDSNVLEVGLPGCADPWTIME